MVEHVNMRLNLVAFKNDGTVLFLVGLVFDSPMGNGGDGSKKIIRTEEMEKLSLGVSEDNFSRDLLHRFRGSSSDYEATKQEDEDIELNLGLSLGGRFGADETSKKLARSSSVAGYLLDSRGDNEQITSMPTPAASTGLMRTASLPVETEEEWRKRKVLQTMRRMEAKRRRSEKQRSVKGDKEAGETVNSSLEARKEILFHSRDKCLEEVKKMSSSLQTVPRFGQTVRRGGVNVAMPKGKGIFVGDSGGGRQGGVLVASQGSVESKGGSSSSLTDVEGNPAQGSSGELSPGDIQSLKVSNQDVSSSSTKSKEENTSQTTRGTPRTRGSSSLEDMPCVFTVGDGPGGRRVDGILYKYGKGEEVRIMCVCCGDFHSPAEFVKHAGGTDFDHPLKHIVVNPHSPSLR